jgi:hypothetical protein
MLLTPTSCSGLWALNRTARTFPFPEGEKSREYDIVAGCFSPGFGTAEVVDVVAGEAVPDAVLVGVALGDWVETY